MFPEPMYIKFQYIYIDSSNLALPTKSIKSRDIQLNFAHDAVRKTIVGGYIVILFLTVSTEVLKAIYFDTMHAFSIPRDKIFIAIN